MKRILFVVGFALGHVARCFVVAHQLKKLGFEVHFLGSDRKGIQRELLSECFRLHEFGGDGWDQQSMLSGAISACVDEVRPSAVVYDLGALNLALAPPTGLPEVYITNFFLTRHGSGRTQQEIRFETDAVQINAQRERLNMPALGNARDLYERDLVLLADPPLFLAELGPLPQHYRIIGPCTWEPDMPLPEELCSLKDVLYMSMGSTATRPLPESLAHELADALSCSSIVAAGDGPSGRRRLQYTYSRLPAAKVLARARFALTHGGTGSVYQSLTNGVPVGCWPSNQNQRVFSEFLELSGFGMHFTEDDWEARIRCIGDRLPELTLRARQVASSLANFDSALDAAKHIQDLI